MPWVTVVRCYCEHFVIPVISPEVEVRKYEIMRGRVTQLDTRRGYSVGSFAYLDRHRRIYPTVIAVGAIPVWRQHPVRQYFWRYEFYSAYGKVKIRKK